ncbi:hypothetical protein DIPPA_07697 [Diplonema papillatum]|nr:hypothetical protein DIPPA_07697 [Diplonema papillatum]
MLVRLLTALSAVAVVAGEPVCYTDDVIKLCLELGTDFMKTAVDRCNAGGELATTSGPATSTKLTISFLDGFKSLLPVRPQFVEASCSSGTTTFEVTHSMSALSVGLPTFVSELQMEMALKVSQAADGSLTLDYTGEVLSGSIEKAFLDFEVTKDGDADAQTVASITANPLGELGLPTQVSFKGLPTSMFKAGNSSSTKAEQVCNLAEMVPMTQDGVAFSPSITVPGTGVVIEVSEGQFNPCGAVALAQKNCTAICLDQDDQTFPPAHARAAQTAAIEDCVEECVGDSEVLLLSMKATATSAVDYEGAKLKELTISIEAFYAKESADNETADGEVEVVEEATDEEEEFEYKVLWAGSVAGRITLFDGVEADFSGAFTSEEGVSDIVIDVKILTSTVRIEGSVEWTAECPSDAEVEASLVDTLVGNKGAVTVEFLNLDDDALLEGEMEQVSCKKWRISGGLLAGATRLLGVQVTEARADLEVSGGNVTGVSGTIAGTVDVAGMLNASGVVTLDKGSFTGLTLSGEINVMDVLVGRATFFTEDASEKMEGSGELSVVFENAAIDITANLTFHNRKASPETSIEAGANVGDVVWEVKGAAERFELYGLELRGLVFEMTGTQGTGEIVWTGTVAGTLALEGVEVEVEVVIDDNAFQSIVGRMQMDRAGVVFDGEFTLDNSSTEEGCTSPSYTAMGTLEVGKHVFEGSLSRNGCAADGEIAMEVSASMEASATAKIGTLLVTRASMEAQGTLGADGKIESWSGVLTGNANIFGGSSTASVTFVNGAFAEVAVFTVFRTANQMLSGDLSIVHVSNCAVFSKGTMNLQVRLAEADPLVLAGDVEFNSCTGELHFVGSVTGDWNAPEGGGLMKEVNLELSLPADEEEAGSGIGKRLWTGVITANTAVGSVGVGLVINFNSNGLSSVSAGVTFETDNIFVGAEALFDQAAGTCTGDGTLIVRNLPQGLPSFEADVTASFSDCSSPETEYTVTGSLENVAFPFFGKTIKLGSAKITATHDAGDNTGVDVEVEGTFGGKFALAIRFNTLDVAGSLKVEGGSMPGEEASPGAFLRGWDSETDALPSSLGVGNPQLLSDMKAFALGSVSVRFDYDDKRVVLEGEGSLYGAAFFVMLAVQKNADKSFAFGLLLEAAAAGLQDLPGALGNVMNQINPQRVQFVVGTAGMGSSGTEVLSSLHGEVKTIRKGLTLMAFLGSDNENVNRPMPDDFKEQVADKESGGGGGTTMMARMTSSRQVDIFLELAGGIELGSSRVKVATLALMFVVQSAGPLKAGFMMSLLVDVGDGDSRQTLTVSGFVLLHSTGSLEIGLEASSPTPWEIAKGASILFPVAVKMTVSPSLVPTEFAITGGVKLADTTGYLTLGVNLLNLGQCAFETEIVNLDLKTIIAQLTGCTKCVQGVGAVLFDVSIGRLKASINTDLFNPTQITFVTETRTIPPGVNFLIEDMNLWGIIVIKEASFSLDGTGIEAMLDCEPINFGPLKITSLEDDSKGPQLDLALKEDKQHLFVSGATTMLGFLKTGILLELRDNYRRGKFEISISQYISFSGEIVSQGTPGKSDFSNTVTATVKIDIEKLVDDATAFLREMQEKANKEFEDADRDLKNKIRKLDSVKRDLSRKEKSALAKIDGWMRKVRSFDSQIRSLNSKCNGYRKRCKRWFPRKCFAYAGCKISVAARKVGRALALAGLNIAKAFVRAGFGLARGAVTLAQGAVQLARGVLKVAQAVVNGFLEVIIAAGGILKKLFSLKELTISATLSSGPLRVSFKVDATIFGARLKFGFQAEISFKGIVKAIGDKIRGKVKEKFGKMIPGL